MICEDTFNAMKARAGSLKYSSLAYLDYDDCKDSKIIHNSDDLILIFDKEDEHLNFAANDFMKIIDGTTKIRGSLFMHLMPREYVATLENAGFEVWAEFVDFFNRDLLSTAAKLGDVGKMTFLDPDRCEEAAEISERCKMQSRGFEGFDAQQLAQWLADGNDIIITEKNGTIAGLCCVAIYNDGKNLWIREMAVYPKYQGLGLGKIIMKQAIAYGVAKGATVGFLAVDLLNKGAIGLYKKYGFVMKSGDDNAIEIQMVRKA